MTMLIYEKIDDFIEKLSTLEKTTAVYITVVHSKQDDVHVASIRLQYMADDLVFHTFNYRENIKPLRMIDPGVFGLIPDEKQQVIAQKTYEAEIDAFNESVHAEYEKAKDLFTRMGYMKIVNAYSV